jgi:hypothetical protein
MRKLSLFLALLVTLGWVITTNAYWYDDTGSCVDRCTGNRYEEPFCPRYCAGYQRYPDQQYYNGYNAYYTYPTYYNNTTPTNYYNSDYRSYDSAPYGYYCASYEDPGYYYNNYSNYQYTSNSNFCDCRGRENCTCTFYPNPNQYNSTGNVRRCLEWRRY